MIGDYYYYMAENAEAQKQDNFKQKILEYYVKANEVEIKLFSPIKLDIALTLSKFYYEIMKNKKAACKLAEKSLRDSKDKLQELDVIDRHDA